jgi:Ca2+-binding EF-hand superfamily protein
MDKTGVGLITYQQFLDVLRTQLIDKPRLNDNFDWEANTISKIKDWISSKKYNVDEAFKLFDHDFDGFVSK